MAEPKTFEHWAQLLIAEGQAAERNLQARLGQEFLRSMLGLRLDLEQSHKAWEAIGRRWEQEKAQKGSLASFRQVLIEYILASGQLEDPIVTEFTKFQKLRASSTLDDLTEAHNRNFFETTLAKEVPRAVRYGDGLSLVSISLRGIEKVIETGGQTADDQLLKLTAKILKESLRASDTAFRVEEHEFALLLPRTAHSGCVVLAERARQRFAEAVEGMNLAGPVSLAYGAATCPEEATNTAGLLALSRQRLRDFELSVTSISLVNRHFRRMPLEGMGAYVILRVDDKTPQGSLLDFSFGGLGFRMTEKIDLPELFEGDLHLPVFPVVSMALRKVYSRREGDRSSIVGCAFSAPPRIQGFPSA